MIIDRFQLIHDLRRALTALAKAKIEMERAKYRLAYLDAEMPLERARAERRAIEAAGSEKALGSNAEARKRALILALDDDEQYQVHLTLIDQARKQLLEAVQAYELAKVDAEVARARLNLALLEVEEAKDEVHVV